MPLSRTVRTALEQWVDLLIAACLLTFELVALTEAVPEPGAPRPVDGLAWALAILAVAPLVVRRRRPVAVLVATSVGLLGYMALGYAPALHGYSLLVALYTVASLRPPRISLLGLAPAVAASLWATTHYASEGTWQSIAGDSVVMIAAWSLGDAARSRRLRAEELSQRVEAVESRRLAETEQAAANERLRIARELHDVMAHSMSMIAVQAGVGRHVLREDLETAERSLDVIAETSRRTLAEMRQMLGVLRLENGDDAARLPQPGIAALDELVSGARAAGLAVTLAISGRPRDLPPSLDLAAYRILQESLTNAAKHAGTGAHVRVGLTWTTDRLELDVHDDGAGVVTAPEHDGTRGHGLIGLRERAALSGGTIHAGPHVSGGFAVRATLPVRAPEPATVAAGHQGTKGLA